MLKVGVIIPTYNQSKLLTEAVDSVLAQTFIGYEIIIIDDGSTDNTKQIIEEYLNKHPGKIRYLYQKNNGPAAARNYGIREANNADYIAFLDHDDIWLPNKLEKQINFLKDSPGYVMCYTDAYEFNSDEITKENKLGKNNREKMSGIIFEKLLMGCFIFNSTVLIKRPALEELGGFDITLISSQDWDLWLRISQKYQIGFLDEVLMGYRRHSMNITNNTELNLKERHFILDKIIRYADIPKKIRKIANKSHAKICFQGAEEYISKNNYSKGRSELIKSLKFNYLKIKPYLLLIKTLLPKELVLLIKKLWKQQ